MMTAPTNPTRNASCTIVGTFEAEPNPFQDFDLTVTWDSPYVNQAAYQIETRVTGENGTASNTDTLNATQTSDLISGGIGGTTALEASFTMRDGSGNAVESGTCIDD